MRKKILLTLGIFGICALASAQITKYSHPPTILAQDENYTVAKDNSFSPRLNNLVIHDVDEKKQNRFKLKLLEGQNYTINNKKVVPNPDFEGILTINVQVNDGKFDSNIFPFKVRIGEENIDENKAIFVATDGDDGNVGTIKSPVKTLGKAKELVAEKGAKVVYFREGQYYMADPVVFSAKDSGTAEMPILYTAYKNEKVRFTGSKRIPYEAFKKAKPSQVERIKNNAIKNKIKVADLKKLGITNYGEIDHVGYGIHNNPPPPARLFVDGSAMNLARYPNVGNFEDVKAPKGKRNFTSKSNIVNDWEQSGDIWIDGPLSAPWEWQKNKIESVDAQGNITMKWDYHTNISSSHINMFYFNVFEELDFPEEYFIDKKNHLLYVFFPANVNKDSDIRISQSTKSFIELSGANNLVFKNLTFEGTRGNAISFRKDSSYNTFDNCTINSIGQNAFWLMGKYNSIRNCYIHNIGAVGVYIWSPVLDPTKPDCNLIYNTKIHDFSQEKRAYNPAITFGGFGQVARHLEVFNGPHMSMLIRGTSHVVEYCDFHNAPEEYSDMLALYMSTGKSLFHRGTIIRRNKFHDVNGTWKQSAGVYMDTKTNGIIVEENYFYNNIAQDSGWSVMVHGGADNVVRGNVFVDCSFPYLLAYYLNDWGHKDFVNFLKGWQEQAQKDMNSDWLRHYPELLNYFDDDDKKATVGKYEYDIKLDKDSNVANYWNLRVPPTNVLEDNLIYTSDPSTMYKMPKSSTKAVVENRGFYVVGSYRVIKGEGEDSIIHSNNHELTEDPGFADVQNYDLRLDKNSAILKKLPYLRNDYFTKIGLIK